MSREPFGELPINKMKIQSGLPFVFFISALLILPVLTKAQEGNHCSVKKSPYRLSMDSGKKVYTLYCMSCHQSDGIGVPNVNPPLNSKQVTGDKNTLINIVIKGSATHQEINGIVYSNVMPPNSGLNDQEIADVLTYIRNSFGNKTSAVKVSEVRSANSNLKKF
jgi:mono/diheme cytochrome c family protein